jgi:mono/diheme cytochrome c family protein
MRGKKGLLLAAILLPVIVPGKVAAQRSGAQVWAETCGNCHMLQPANRYTAERWSIIVRHMQINARLTDEETNAVREFLLAGARRTASLEPRQDGGIQVASKDVAYVPVLGQDGEDIYKKQCAACHGKKGEGDGPAAVALNPRPANLADEEAMEALTDEQLRKIIGQGIGAMPGFDSILQPDELESVLKYIRSLTSEEE